jgi:hypothetical protein
MREKIINFFKKLATGAWIPLASIMGSTKMAYAAEAVANVPTTISEFNA